MPSETVLILKKIYHRRTATAPDQDTDSNEAIRERLDEVFTVVSSILAAGGGTYGRFKGMPVMEHERDVFWFKPTGTGDADATTGANAATSADDNITVYGTLGQDDVFLYLGGSHDFNGAAAGLTVPTNGDNFSIFGLGGQATRFVNSNAGATAVITINGGADNIQIAGISFRETTNTVEGVVINSENNYIHDNKFESSMENGIRIAGAGSDLSVIENNFFNGITNDAIEIDGSTSIGGTVIIHNHFTSVGDNCIHINGDLADNNFIIENYLDGSAGTTDTGINIALGDKNMISGNTIGGCVALYADTGSDNIWEDNHGTLETDYTTALDGNVQDFFGTGAAHQAPLNETGVVRIYPDYNAMGAADTVVIIVNRKNDGTNSRQAVSITKTGVQTDKCPMYDITYTKTRTIHLTIQRTAGAVAAIPVGIVEVVN